MGPWWMVVYVPAQLARVTGMPFAICRVHTFVYTQITPCLCNFTRLVCVVGDSGQLKGDQKRVGVLPQFKKCS
jgi:hypothetical protein